MSYLSLAESVVADENGLSVVADQSRDANGDLVERHPWYRLAVFCRPRRGWDGRGILIWTSGNRAAIAVGSSRRYVVELADVRQNGPLDV